MNAMNSKPAYRLHTVSHCEQYHHFPWLYNHYAKNTCQQRGVFTESPQRFCWNRFIVMWVGCFGELQQALCITKKKTECHFLIMSAPTHPFSEECVFTPKRKAALFLLLAWHLQETLEAALPFWIIKGKESEPQQTKKTKNLSRCRSPSKFEEQAFKEKDYRMLINSYCLRWWRGKAEKETQPGFYHHIQGLLRTKPWTCPKGSMVHWNESVK